MTELVNRLMETPLGKHLGAADAAELVGAGAQRGVVKGRYLFKAGEAGYSLFIVLSGGFDVILGQTDGPQTTVASVGAGQVVGELELMTQSARVASLLASDDAQVLEISGTRFDAMLAQNRPAANKLLAMLAKALARRLAAVNQRIVAKLPPPAPKAVAQHVPPPPMPRPEMSEADLDVLDKLWG